MSKQKIREWLKENILMTGYAPLEDIIHQYTNDQSAWVSVDIEPRVGQEVLIKYR